MPADRLDRQIHVLQSEGVGRDLFQRKSFRCDLLQRELARPETMTARALHGDSFDGDLADWEIRKVRHLTLHHDGSSTPFQRVYSKENRHRSRTSGTVEH